MKFLLLALAVLTLTGCSEEYDVRLRSLEAEVSTLQNNNYRQFVDKSFRCKLDDPVITTTRICGDDGMIYPGVESDAEGCVTHKETTQTFYNCEPLF